MSLEPEHRSFLPSYGERANRSRPRKELRRKPYTLAEVSNHVDDLADGFEDIVFFLTALRALGDKTWRFLKIMTPVMIGALLASGVVTGPIGEALKYIAANWPS